MGQAGAQGDMGSWVRQGVRGSWVRQGIGAVWGWGIGGGQVDVHVVCAGGWGAGSQGHRVTRSQGVEGWGAGGHLCARVCVVVVGGGGEPCEAH